MMKGIMVTMVEMRVLPTSMVIISETMDLVIMVFTEAMLLKVVIMKVQEEEEVQISMDSILVTTGLDIMADHTKVLKQSIQ